VKHVSINFLKIKMLDVNDCWKGNSRSVTKFKHDAIGHSEYIDCKAEAISMQCKNIQQIRSLETSSSYYKIRASRGI
jgi:hypothetical protein